MHELSVASAIVATVEKHADGRPVELVNLRVGTLRQVVPATLRCEACGAEWELDEPVFRCACGSTDVEVAAGEELQVESIEIREEEVACIAPQ